MCTWNMIVLSPLSLFQLLFISIHQTPFSIPHPPFFNDWLSTGTAAHIHVHVRPSAGHGELTGDHIFQKECIFLSQQLSAANSSSVSGEDWIDGGRASTTTRLGCWLVWAFTGFVQLPTTACEYKGHILSGRQQPTVLLPILRFSFLSVSSLVMSLGNNGDQYTNLT